MASDKVVNDCIHDTISGKSPCSNDSDYANASGGFFKNLGLSCLYNIATGGIYSDIKCHKCLTCVVRGVVSMGISDTYEGQQLMTSWTGAGQKEANVWNSTNVETKFPLSANPTCDELNNLIAALQQELVTVDQQSASQPAKAKSGAAQYKGKVDAYIAKVQGIYNTKNCKQVLLNEAAQNQCALDQQAAANALALMQQKIAANNAVSAINPLTIGLVLGGILLVSIIGVAIYHKKKVV